MVPNTPQSSADLTPSHELPAPKKNVRKVVAWVIGSVVLLIALSLLIIWYWPTFQNPGTLSAFSTDQTLLTDVALTRVLGKYGDKTSILLATVKTPKGIAIYAYGSTNNSPPNGFPAPYLTVSQTDATYAFQTVIDESYEDYASERRQAGDDVVARSLGVVFDAGFDVYNGVGRRIAYCTDTYDTNEVCTWLGAYDDASTDANADVFRAVLNGDGYTEQSEYVPGL